MALLEVTESGLYCAAGDFYIDPWRRVPYAVITHAHADHARRGSRGYLTSVEGRHVLATRMQPNAAIETAEWGRPILRRRARITLFPAGHVLGSAQVRVEFQGETWVVSGDYKTESDRTCRPWEPVRCHTWITESTFGLPIYRWQPQQQIFEQINAWWKDNQAQGRPSILSAYSLGKAQRLLAGVNAEQGPIVCHRSVEDLNEAYRRTGITLPPTSTTNQLPKDHDYSRSLIIAPPTAVDAAWARKLKNASRAIASGWALVRGTRRRAAADRGFVLSDHADWPGLLHATAETGAERVLVTHGQVPVMVRYFRDQGLDAAALNTPFGETEDERDGTETPAPAP